MVEWDTLMPLRQSLTSRKDPNPNLGPVRRFWHHIRGWRWYYRWLVMTAISGLLLVLLAWTGFEIYFGSLARGYSLTDLGKMPERSMVFDAAGNVLGKLHGANRVVVDRSEVAPAFFEALLAREDSRFYEHGGVDWIGVARALMRNVRDGKRTQGASTLTMQLARNSFGLTEQKSLHRKLLEIALTQRIESSRSKDEILEMYANRVFFGNGIYGVERASQAYFGKNASDLELHEAALLAGIIRSPNRFSPYRNYAGAVAQRDAVLERMVETARLTAPEAEAAKRKTTKVAPPPQSNEQEDYGLDAVRRELEVLLDMDEVEDGGLKIYTTLDPHLQHAAEESLESRLSAVERLRGYEHQTRAGFAAARQSGTVEGEPQYLQGAVVVVENGTGAIRALVGGRDYADSSYNRALLARRQVGSTFKPFVYAAAVEHAHLFPQVWVNDDPLTAGEIRSAEGDFAPHNSDGNYVGLQPAEFGLIKSRNTMTVRVGERAGLDQVLKVAKEAGLKDITGRSPQIYIGNLGATLKSLTSAYSLFPNNGKRCRPFLIDRIETADGEMIFRSGKIEYEVIRTGAAWVVTQMLSKVTERGTAAAAQALHLKSPIAGKTGTTDDFKDAWFVGFSPALTCGVWVGLDDPERIVWQGYGSRLALPIWGDIMKQAEANGFAGGQFVPPAMQSVSLCRQSGQLAVPACGDAAAHVAVPADLVPTAECSVHHGGAPPGQPPPAPRAEPSLWDRFKSLFR